MKPTIIRAEQILANWLQSEVPSLQYTIDEMRELRGDLLAREPDLAHRITEMRRRIIEEAVRRSGIDHAEAVSHHAIEVFLTARNTIDFFPGALDTLRALSGSYILGALSNGNADISRLGLNDIFSFGFSAEEVGLPKPAPDLFLQALRETGVGPESVVYVGDDPVLDIDAASAIGMRTVWMNSRAKPRGASEPGATITDIRDLPGAIAGIAQAPDTASH